MLGTEPDFSYVRFVLAAAGYSAPPHPQPFSSHLPIPPSFFDILEALLETLNDSSSADNNLNIDENSNTNNNSHIGGGYELAASTDEGRSDAAARSKSVSTVTSPIPPASHSTDEQRQRRLLFDATNEALGRCLLPAITVSDGQAVDGVVMRMEGTGLMQAVWAEMCSWPVPPFSSVCDVLDEAGRRDVVRGGDRWQEDESSGVVEAMVILELEEEILEEIMEDLCKEIALTDCFDQDSVEMTGSGSSHQNESRREEAIQNFQ